MTNIRMANIGICLAAILLLHSLILAQSDQRGEKSPDPQVDAAGVPTTQKKATEDVALKLNTALVNVPVIVTDRVGKYIPNLTQNYFEIFEENVKQNIDAFSSVEVPFNVVLLIDTSKSTFYQLEDIQKSALAFIDLLREQDRVMVVSFDTQVYIDSEFTNDRKKLRKAILETRSGTVTRVYDAVDLVLTERLANISGRKAIVLFSDGVDTGSLLATARSTIDLVEESDVLVYIIQYDTREDMRERLQAAGATRGSAGHGQVLTGTPIRGSTEEEYRVANRYLRELADHSGARLFKVDMLGDVNQSFQLIADELRHQYMLSYYPTNDKRDGNYRRIRVVVNQPNIAVRARKGYRAESETQTIDKN
jgi:Ca-activated chloride channel homolog